MIYMKKSKFKLAIYLVDVFILIIFSIIGINYYNNLNKKEDIFTDNKIKKDSIDINKIINKYNNSDIVGYIYIPNVLSSPILQSSTNEYYLSHDNYGNYDKRGTVTLDYRVKLNDRKILLYGHSGTEKNLPFVSLNNYTKESYYKKHDKIYIYDVNNNKYTYKIFSAYIEKNDFDYVNIKDFNGLSWKEHLDKLKSKSIYNTNVILNDNSKIIILQTCSMIDEGTRKYQLVIGVLI